MEMIYDDVLKDYICYAASKIIRVTKVDANSDYTLFLTFSNGEKKLYDAAPLLGKSLYKELNSLDFFLSAKEQYGTVVWSDEIDIAPEHLYEHSVTVGG